METRWKETGWFEMKSNWTKLNETEKKWNEFNETTLFVERNSLHW